MWPGPLASEADMKQNILAAIILGIPYLAMIAWLLSLSR
jgi:hypothetical protein